MSEQFKCFNERPHNTDVCTRYDLRVPVDGSLTQSVCNTIRVLSAGVCWDGIGLYPNSCYHTPQDFRPQFESSFYDPSIFPRTRGYYKSSAIVAFDSQHIKGTTSLNSIRRMQFLKLTNFLKNKTDQKLVIHIAKLLFNLQKNSA